MKKLLIGVFFIALAGPLAAPAMDVMGPRIAAKELRHDLGKVTQGTHVSHVFEIRSEGTETLVIERIQSS